MKNFHIRQNSESTDKNDLFIMRNKVYKKQYLDISTDLNEVMILKKNEFTTNILSGFLFKLTYKDKDIGLL